MSKIRLVQSSSKAKVVLTCSRDSSQFTSRAAAHGCACSGSSCSQDRSSSPEADAPPRFRVNSANQEGPLTCCTATDCLSETCMSDAVQEGSWRRAFSSGAASWCRRPPAYMRLLCWQASHPVSIPPLNHMCSLLLRHANMSSCTTVMPGERITRCTGDLQQMSCHAGRCPSCLNAPR